MSLRDKIYQVCQMLYSQQSKAGYNLALLESKIMALRQDFTHLVLQKHTWETEASVNELFERSERIEINS